MRRDRLATGRVWHRRRAPGAHAFSYRLCMSLLDVDTIAARFHRSRLWSVERFNVVTFRRSDFIGPHSMTVGAAVRQRVEDELGFRPDGRVRMLAHLRQWGHCFNPVAFYFCENGEGGLQAVVAEVHNTPWNERHAYVLDARAQRGPAFRFQFDKAFHVSPFLPMDLRYDWRLHYRAERIDVHMRLMRDGTQCFESGMRLALQELTPRRMRRMPFYFPPMTARVTLGIYYQAFRLWLRRAPFFKHPGRTTASGAGSR